MSQSGNILSRRNKSADPQLKRVKSAVFMRLLMVQLFTLFGYFYNLYHLVHPEMNNISIDFQRIGCEDQLKCALGARVFTDMKLEYVLVDKCYAKSLDVAYLRTEHKDQSNVMVLPLLCQHDVNFRLIGQFQSKVLGSPENKLMLAICDTSSNILYYNIGNGILEKS